MSVKVLYWCLTSCSTPKWVYTHLLHTFWPSWNKNIQALSKCMCFLMGRAPNSNSDSFFQICTNGKMHFYWAIDKCDGDGDRLRDNLDKCITHFQNDHSNCDHDSSCRKAPYIPSFEVVTIRLPFNFLQILFMTTQFINHLWITCTAGTRVT